VGYIFPIGGKLTIQQMMQSGSWREINESQKDKPVRHDVFSLWLSHSTTPMNESYTYIVMPDKPLSYFKNGSINHGFEIVKNTTTIQAVKNSVFNSYAVVFYEPGTVDMGDGLTITSDAKGMVYIEKMLESYNVSVSDPIYSQKDVNITLNNKTIHFDFPQGDYQGSTTTQSYKL
jgi:chondroitin AC lyase